MSMTVPEILKELELHTGKFPREAMEAAIEQREAITPELIRVLQTVADAPAEWAPRQDYMLHLFATYLLAQFQEQAAYPVLVRIVSAPGDIPYQLYGDSITGALGRILASVYDGNPELLRGLVENPGVDEFVRGAALKAFLVLVFSGRMPREAVVEYFRSLFRERLKQEGSYIWDALAGVVTDLPAPELREELRRAYDEGWTDPSMARLDELEAEMEHPRPERLERYSLMSSAIAEMEGWSAFDQKDEESARTEWATAFVPQPVPEPPPRTHEPAQPYVREVKVGRNDPCPCGSGKKHKKCCGG